MRVVIDASVLVGLLNPRDLWRKQALTLRQALLDAGNELLYFDCVVAEAVSAAVRRLHEKGRTSEVETLMDRLNAQAAPADITWILPDVPHMYPDILALIRSSSGELNFNDALIALACRQRDIPAIASFDADFDHVPWLRRLTQPKDIQS
jgi:predicted nucleic acid-binding protein